MQVEHITFIGNSVVRDTDQLSIDIKKGLEAFRQGSATYEIEDFICKTTVEDGMAVFDLLVEKEYISINYCCFSKESKERILYYAMDFVKKMNTNYQLVFPKSDYFIISILNQNLSAKKHHFLPIAGDMALYIYDAIYEGVKERSVKPQPTEQDKIGLKNFEVGKKFPLSEYTGMGDVTKTILNPDFFDVVVSFTDPTPKEIVTFGRGELETGLFIYENVPFLYLDFKNFSVDASLDITKMKNQKDAEAWIKEETSMINLYLIDSKTGVIKAQRLISIDFGADIRRVLEQQKGTSGDRVNQTIVRVNNTYTTKQMQEKAIKKMHFKK